MKSEMPEDYTDYAYQVKLPMHARSTASKAVKNNLRNTEILADPCLIVNAQKVCLNFANLLTIQTNLKTKNKYIVSLQKKKMLASYHMILWLALCPL